AINESGDTALFPPVDMVFDPDLNLLDYQISPADIDEPVRRKIESLALSVVKGLKSPGLFAVEMFIDPSGKVYVNETAPRVHNSGHHTIEGNFCSQFDMLWRILLDYPLGNPETLLPSALVNLLGEEGHQGKAIYAGLEEVLAMPNVFVHIYGKSHTKPGRKMGHVTILDENPMNLTHKAHKIRELLRVKSC
ncbi:MAG: ATP-grasp domain-containing protein, partial [Chitinophagaceae bacterium]